MAQIFSIVYQPNDREYGESLADYIRVPLESANLIANHGIEGDQKAGHSPNRQLNLISHEWLERMQSQGFRTAPGEFGEQVIIRGLAVEELPPGARLQIGDSATIEITKSRTGCERLQAAQPRSIAEIKASIGMLARVLTGGPIRVGDPVTILTPVEA